MRALITHYSFATIGGAERVSLKVVGYLSNVLGMKVDILCYDAPDVERVRLQYGLVVGTDVRFIGLSGPVGTNLQLFRIAHLHRESRKIAAEYDLCISTYNEQDFGFPALQYVHHPIFESREVLRRYRIIPRENVIDRYGVLEKVYYGFLNAYAGADVQRRRQNLTMTNSGFMGGILRECGYGDLRVLYPGFLQNEGGAAHGVGVEKRHRIFSLGRIEPDKHTLNLVQLYKALHEVDPELELVICGLTGSADYLAQVRELVDSLGVPITFMLDQDRKSVLELIHSSKFYINPKPFEHFGIATVEAIEAGCIPFVHNSGGNKELVPFGELRFDDVNDLVAGYNALRNDIPRQDQILRDLGHTLEAYSSDTFFKLFHEIIRLYLKDKGTVIGPYKELK